MEHRWPVWKLAALLYVFAAGAVAINLFMLGIPRLSVDIDISYIGAEGREAMMEEAERRG